MADQDCDLFVIGVGSAGVRLARRAADSGARVVAAEERYLGGTCVNVGCIPKKLLVYASHFSEDFEDAAAFGWSVGERSFDWQTLIANKDKEISRLNGIYGGLLENAGAELVEGHAVVAGPNRVEVAGRGFRAEHIVVATGRVAEVPRGGRPRWR